MTISVESKILKQVEFYFGDANMPRDKFLLEKSKETEAGWIPVETIASFSRMKSITEDMETIKEAIATSSSEIVELNEEKTCIRRKSPLPEHQETLTRALYIKGFPQTATLDELEAFFAQHSSAISAIRQRRHHDSKEFKGSVFVEFTTEEDAKKFAELSLTFEGQALTINTKMEWLEEENSRLIERQKRKADKSEKLLGDYGRDRLIKILDFPAEGITHEALKDALKETFPVAYVDFGYEPNCAWLRLKESKANEFAQEYAEKALEIGEFKLVKFQVATEEEQLGYLSSIKGSGRRNTGRTGGQRNNRKRPAATSTANSDESQNDNNSADNEESVNDAKKAKTDIAQEENKVEEN